MKELPILFSTPMVQANLEGRKTNTRRLTGLDNINEDPDAIEFLRFQEYKDGSYRAIFQHKLADSPGSVKCPYGKAGDVLWVRETHMYVGRPNVEYIYKCGYPANLHPALINIPSSRCIDWKPSIHMPKDAARIWMCVEEIRVERLQDISEEDAKSEGAEPMINTFSGIDNFKNIKTPNYRTGFMKIWIKINGEESWKANPWVWVVKYKVLSTTGKPSF